MGMLFNTPETLKIISLVNQRFNARGLATLKQDDAASANKWRNAFHGLQGNTYNVAQLLGIDFDIGTKGSSPLAKRWKKWCDYIDNNNDNQGSGNRVSFVIGRAIYDVITGHNPATQIEFFAVPDDGGNAVGDSVGVSTGNYTESGGAVSLIITIYTQTVDNLN